MKGVRRPVVIDLLAMAELKHEYERTRPNMHGEKVL